MTSSSHNAPDLEFRRLTVEAKLPSYLTALLIGIPIGHSMAKTAFVQSANHSDDELQQIAGDVLALITGLAVARVTEIAEQAALHACHEEFDRLRRFNLLMGGRA